MTTEPPPLTRDIEVMTDLSCIDSSTSPNLPDDSKDLATNILGVQVSSFLDTIQWSSGFTTILPCIWKDEKNLCQVDADMVQYFSQLPEFDPESSTHIVHIHQCDWSSKPGELCNLVAETLREGKCIVIWAAQKSQPVKLDVDYLES
jgi:hypothetical protein